MQLSRFLVSGKCSSDTVALYTSLYPKPIFLTASDSERIIEGKSTDRVSHLLSKHYCFSSGDDNLFERYVGFNHATKGKIDAFYAKDS